MRKITMLSLLLFAAITGKAFAYDVQLKPFQDVGPTDWFYDNVYSLAALGMINGESAAIFHPDGLLSREAFVKLIVAASREETQQSSASSLPDVPADRWSYPYIAYAAERHWINFMLDASGQFHPAQPITREEVAALIGKMLLESLDEPSRSQWLQSGWIGEKEANPFKDSRPIAEAIAPYVYYAVHQGILEGDERGFRPGDLLPRKEAAAIIYRCVDLAATGQALDVTGFYAIRSYPAIGRISSLSNVIFGWSHLQYDKAGQASLQTEATEYRIPDGWEQAVEAAKAANIHSELMVYSGGASLRDFVKDKAAQAAFIDSLLQTLDDPQYPFTGVCIDFEGLKEEAGAADYVAFLSALKAKLGHRSLTVAVPPVYYYKGYDLKKIGDIADTVILMAYDFTDQGGKLPSAPLPLVNDTVRQALVAIPKEKLVLGISKQANQWITSQGGTSYYEPEIDAVERRLAAQPEGQSWSLPYHLKQITFQDERGSHLIYYEDAESIAKKLWLAQYYGLKGVSIWHMGNATASDWDAIHAAAK
ncbi:glycosyl hydrolase family 18 protein [Paenibacillus solanacearum]|nr:glycosyl hydrolase family 18 protein [Paenibacillus solanacearum]